MTRKYTTYLSFDCANKSFAMSYTRIRDYWDVLREITLTIVDFVNTTMDGDWPTVSGFIRGDIMQIQRIAKQMTMNHVKTVDVLTRIDQILSTVIHVQACNCIDLMPGRKLRDVDVLERTRLLKQVLLGMPTVYDRVLIEHQSAALNFISSTVQDQLTFYYSDSDVTIVKPKRKNEHCFANQLKHEVFLAKYKKAYDANKAHTRANFAYFAKIFNVDTTHFPRANMDDVADAFMQTIAYHYGGV